MLISRAIANLFNGVSQQPASMRLPTQAELSDNVYANIATGTRKRPPTQHLAKLSVTPAADAFVHAINKDVTHRFIVIITTGSIAVFDATTGAQHTVTYPSGVPAMLTSGTPRDDFVALTVADYTFIANRNTTVAMTGATAAGAIAGTKNLFSALPATPSVGDIWKIQGDPSNNFDIYYVKWNGSAWVECCNPGVLTQFDATTMPYKLIQTGTTTWTFDKATWTDRLVGDDTSNAKPSFVTRQIRDIFYYRGRLGFIADENVILSRATDPFGFWAQSATAVLDSDPVDRTVTNTKVSILNYVVPFNKALILFSDQTQFEFTAGDVVTPKTPKVDPVTEFQSAKKCRPVAAGSSLFFAVERSNSTAIREYYVDRETFSNDAADVTAHVPTYLPANVFKLASCTTEDTMFALSLTNRNMVWVYKYYWGQENGAMSKIQSAWGTFTFDPQDVILGVEFIVNTAYFVIQRADGIYLETMNLQANVLDGNLGFLVHLDRRASLTGVYNAGTNLTTWTLPYADATTFTAVLGDSFGNNAGIPLAITRPDSSHVAATGDWSAGPVYIGRNYTMRYRFSTIYLRDYPANVAITNGKLKLKRLLVNYDKSGYFRAEVTPLLRSTYKYEMLGTFVGGAVPDQSMIVSGTFAFPVACENTLAQIDIVNDTFLPSTIQSAEWEGEFTIKTARRF